MLKLILFALIPIFGLLNDGLVGLFLVRSSSEPPAVTGVLEKMIVANGSVAMELDLDRLNGGKGTGTSILTFDVARDTFFTVLVYDGELRGPLPGSMAIVPSQQPVLPAKLSDSYRNLIVESNAGGGDTAMTIRDGKSGFVFFNVSAAKFEYDPNARSLRLTNGRLLISKEFADELGRRSDAGAPVGTISFTANVRLASTTQVVNNETVSETLPANPENGSVPGPDVVVGNLFDLSQWGENATHVGLAVGTDSCNFGTVDLNWLANPDNDHPVIPQNLYRMSGSATNDERFEQIGQSSVKHAFTALTQNICGLGCNGVGGTRLGSGCSDPYDAGLNEGPSLGSRAWINPFTGSYPRNDGDVNNRNNNHSSHNHSSGPLHRIMTLISDLTAASNPGATYYSEAQYVTPHEYAHCQANPTQCNMYNNASYRRFNITGGNGSAASRFTFSPPSATERMKSAVNAWPGATIVEVKPAPGVDGVMMVAYKVTNPSAGVWHYEYAVYNQNLDRGVQSFSIPIGNGVTLSNIGFHAPPQHPGSPFDGTVGNTGFSSTPWAQSQTANAMTWSTETFAQNQNANAIRWGTLYNFRFDSNRPPQTNNATVGFFKTGTPVNVQIQTPSVPSSSFVSVGGRVTTLGWRGLGYARVTLSEPGGSTRTVYTSSFGNYNFDNVATGVTYTISVSKKRYTFTPQQIQVNDNLQNVNFTAN